MKFRFIRKTHTGYFEQHIYQNNGNLAVAIVSWETDGGYWTPFGTLSVNTDLRLPINQFVAKTWDGQDELLAQFVKDGYFTDTGRRTICGRVENVPIYQITEKFLAEVGKAPEGTVHMTIDRYAEVNANEFFKHAANKAWCEANGDNSQKDWKEAEGWQRESAIKGVEFRLNNPEAGKDSQHNAWMADKIAAGWVYGEVKDADAKTHPCIVPFEQLPEFQQKKDALFCAVVDSLK